MDRSDQVSLRGRGSLIWAACGALSALALALSPGIDQPALQANGLVPYDSDRDGLPDKQELQLGTSPVLADSDFDGFSDGIEVLQGSSPFSFDSVPASGGEVSTSVTARGGDGEVHLLFALYAQDGNLANKTLDVSVYSQGRFASVALHRLLPYAETNVVNTMDGGKIMTIDVSLPPYSVLSLGSITWIATAGIVGQPVPLASAKADLGTEGNVILWRRSGHLLPPSVSFAASFSSTAGPEASIHEPIPPGGEQDVVGWEPFQICIQQSAVVGSEGPVLIHEIIKAECQAGWASYCDPGCAGTVGDTFETVDTLAILGG